MAAVNVALRYGDGAVELRIPERLVAGHWNLARVAAGFGADAGSREAILGRAVDELRAAGFERAVRGRRLGLLLADGTRDWSPEVLLPPLLPLCTGASSRTAFLATGTHDPASALNVALAERVARVLGAGWQLAVHDGHAAGHVDRGVTTRGTRVQLDERATSCAVFLTVADMKNHYFAGYSNPTKYLVPGLASAETVRGNHSLALEPESTFGRHPWHPDPARRTNPLAEDLLEAYELAVEERPSFALTLVGAGSDVHWAAGGTTHEATRRGIEVVDRVEGLRLEPTRYLVVSPGGSPHDESLYTAQRALELSRAAVTDGGRVLFLAACDEGIGPPGARENFYEPLTRPLEEIVALPREAYVLYAHKPVKLARYLRGLDEVAFATSLDRGTVERIHLTKADDPQAVVDEWIERIGRAETIDAPGDPSQRITLIDDASRFAVYAG